MTRLPTGACRGIIGSLDRITTDQWLGASIRPQDGTTFGTPITWDKIVESYGGKTLLVPELKRPVTDLEGFTASILDRGIQDNVFVQSADYEVCRKLAAAGLRTVLVILSGQPVPAQINAGGIGHVAVSRDLPVSYFRELKDAGLETWVFLRNRAGPLQDYLYRGMDGVYTDDLWKLEHKLAERGRAVSGAP